MLTTKLSITSTKMMRLIIIILTGMLLTGCTGTVMTSMHYQPDFQDILSESNKTVLVLEPDAIIYAPPTEISSSIGHSAKVNHSSSELLRQEIRKAIISVLNEKQYHTEFFSDKSTLATTLKKQLKSDIEEYINDGRPEDSEILNYNIGQTAIELGKLFNADLIVNIKSTSNYETFLNLSRYYYETVEISYGEVVFIDAKTGNVIYSNANHSEHPPKVRNGPKHYKHVLTTIENLLQI